MKRLVRLTAVLLLVSFLLPAYADMWIDNISISEINVYIEENAEVTSHEECPHVNLHQMSDLQRRCLYENAAWHVIYAFYQIQCLDCYNFVREVTVSETLEEHQFTTTDFCDAINNAHTYFSRCNRCGHETRTTIFCRGVHTEICTTN